MKWFLSVCLLLITSFAFAEDGKNNIIILLDNSASMDEQMRSVRETKMNIAKKVLAASVDKIPADTNIGLITFDGWVYELGIIERPSLIQAINSSNTSRTSGTPLGTYMKKAADRLLQEREKSIGSGTYKLLVVTDGNPTNEPAGLVEKYLPDILSRGLKIECIGVDMALNHNLSNKVHRYMKADDPKSFQENLNKVLGEIQVGKDDLTGFEEIQGLPEPVVKAVIEKLTAHENYPIGEQAPKKVIFEETSNHVTSPQQVMQAPTTSQSTGLSTIFIVGCIFAGLIVIIGMVCTYLAS